MTDEDKLLPCPFCGGKAGILYNNKYKSGEWHTNGSHPI